MSASKEVPANRQADDRAGHKKRLRTDFRNNGLSSMQPYIMVEMLLSFSIRRKDTKPIAKKLLKQFGTVRGILDADYDDLLAVEGIGERTATYLTFVSEVAREYDNYKTKRGKLLNSEELVDGYISQRLKTARNERIFIVCLTPLHRVIAEKTIGYGSSVCVETSLRAIVETALKFNAAGVIIGHNHPKSSPMPSQRDAIEAKRIKDALLAVNIVLADFVIVGEGGETYSLLRSGLVR